MGMWDHLPIAALTTGTSRTVRKLCATNLTGSSYMVYASCTHGGFATHLGAMSYQWSRN